MNVTTVLEQKAVYNRIGVEMKQEYSSDYLYGKRQAIARSQGPGIDVAALSREDRKMMRRGWGGQTLLQCGRSREKVSVSSRKQMCKLTRDLMA